MDVSRVSLELFKLVFLVKFKCPDAQCMVWSWYIDLHKCSIFVVGGKPTWLGGGFKNVFLCSPLSGEMLKFD